MKTSDEYTCMNVYLDRKEHAKFTVMCVENTTFPHRVLVELVRHYNVTGLPKLLLMACIEGHKQSVAKIGRPKKGIDKAIK